ncbi:MAG TPA: phosphotransferase family protein [Acidimicrobiales bacterium]|nr:phosphotransferase family protein [Acidimicrobiales bacterium]
MGDQTIQGTEAPRGIDALRVTDWFVQHVPGVQPPLDFHLVAGGRSNLTFLVTDGAAHRYVLRRPPTGHLLPTAHDMAREHRIIAAMGPAGVPVPPALGLCEDPEVNGAPFYVMGFVDGIIARTEADVRSGFDEEARHRAGLALIDTLADIHQADPDRIGLGDLGRKEGYIARQLKRWYGNYQAANQARGGDSLPAMDELHDRLSAAIPEQGPATVVHGDYRLDNCVVAPDGSRVEAVLDWELCTLGDPLADVGQLLVYWPEPGERAAIGVAATTVPGFPRRDELTARYAERTGRELPQLGFYVAFAYWKLACILEGVYARYVGGAMGDDGFDFSFYPDSIRFLAERSSAAADELDI